MVFDRTEHEPEEWDPEEDLTDPDSGSLTIPTVETEVDENPNPVSVPEVSVNTDTSDVPADLQQLFWALVLILNAAVLAVSLGLLFLIFEGDVRRSAFLLAGGLVLFGFAVRRYRNYQRSDDDSDDDNGNGDGDDGSASSADSDTTTTDADTDGDSESEPEQSTSGETTSGTVPEQRAPDDTDRP